MKKMRLLAALPLFAMGLCATVTAATNIVTPEQLFPQLDSILKQAVAQSPRMVSRAVDLEIAENDRIAARSALLPSIGGSLSIYEAKDKRGDIAERLDVTKTYYSFSITQPLYHWGERRNIARIGEIRHKIAEGSSLEAYRLLAQEVRSLYLRLIMDKLRAEKAALYQSHTANQLKRGEERLAKKVISDAQMFGIRIEAERAQINAERAQFDLENDKASFARLTGGAALTDDQIPDAVPAVASQAQAVQDVLAAFLSQKDPVSVEAQNYRDALEIERLNLANQKTRLLPKFNLVVGTTQDEQSYSLDVAQKYQVNSIFGGFSMSWTMFDGFSARSATRNGLAKVRQMERDYRSLTERLATQAQSQAKLAGFQARSASIYDRLLDSSEGNLRTKNEEFQRGVIAEEDVVNARIGLIDAQINAFANRAEYYTILGEFLATVREDPILANLSAK